MQTSRFSRSVSTLIGLGVAVPALLLAGLAIFLTLRIASAVEDESIRYNSYITQQVVEAFELELQEQLKVAIQNAESEARIDAPVARILVALGSGSHEFLGAHFVPLDDLNGYSILMIESQPLLYAPGEGARQSQYFTGLLLRGSDGQVIGAGGWWIDPRRFLAQHVNTVVQERLPGNSRMYGGYESTRRLSVTLFSPGGVTIGHVREPGDERTARTAELTGPFEGYLVRVAATSSAPVTWTGRFVMIEIAFIVIMALAIIVATVFGLRYTMRQLELAQLKSGFVSNVTHELKTPIALIRLAVETLEMRRVQTPEESEKFLRTIGRETLRLSQLVDNILDFARLEAGQHIFRFEEVDLAQVIRDTIESFRPRFEHLGFTLDVDVPEQLPPVRGDATALTHVLLNLLDNAVKYSKNRREVRIAAGARGDTVAMSVSDRGIGISAGDQRRIFEKFVRLETGLVHDVKGAGLGLSLVDQIVRAHGGRIEVASNTGEGSTFTIVLPATASAPEQGVEASRKTAS
jgi:signal transduction histidine kinase